MLVYKKVLNNRARLAHHPLTYKIPCKNKFLCKSDGKQQVNDNFSHLTVKVSSASDIFSRSRK